MKLFLLRHAHALPGELDEARRLSPKGRRQVQRLSRVAIRDSLCEVRMIEHSGLVRSLETAQILQKHFKLQTPLKKLNGIKPDDPPRFTAKLLAQSPGSRLIVGHNPHFASLVGLFLGLRAGAEGIKFRKAGMVALECLTRPTAKHRYGRWRLLWMVTPPNESANS